MKRIEFVITGIFLVLNSFSQNNLVQIESHLCEYYVDQTIFSQIDFHYLNSSDSSYVLWIERGNVDSLSNSQKIKKHFYDIKGDFSLMQLLWDGNVASFVPGLFDSFFKVIKPNEEFTVSIIKRGGYVSQVEMIKALEKRIVIVNAIEIRGLPIDHTIDMFNYSAKNVTILAEWLN